MGSLPSSLLPMGRRGQPHRRNSGPETSGAGARGLGLEVFPDPGGNEGRRVREESLQRENTAGPDRAERGARKEEPARETMFALSAGCPGEAGPPHPQGRVCGHVRAIKGQHGSTKKEGAGGQCGAAPLLRTTGKTRGPGHPELATVFWVVCSGGHPEKMRELLTLIICEARRCVAELTSDYLSAYAGGGGGGDVRPGGM